MHGRGKGNSFPVLLVRVNTSIHLWSWVNECAFWHAAVHDLHPLQLRRSITMAHWCVAGADGSAIEAAAPPLTEPPLVVPLFAVPAA
jgi:hypothetical protein